MGETINAILLNADYFILLLFRVGGLIFSSPIFGRVNLPNIAKIGLITALTFFFFSVYPQSGPIEYTTLIGFALICILELLLGMAMAFITNIFFTLTFTAGQLIDMQIGFGIVNVYDVQNRTQIPMTGNILNLILLIVFFISDGHLKLIRIIYITIGRMPIGTLSFSPAIGLTVLEVFAMSFMLGIMVALPVVASGLTLEIILGVLMRAVPQIHMFVIGVPLKLLVGLLVVFVTLPVFVGFSERIFSEMFTGIENVFSAFMEVT